MIMTTAYPVMKKPVPVGKYLYFQSSEQVYKVKKSNGVSYGDKGFSLVCQCVDSPSTGMMGREYSFDDRVFRAYNENNIVVLGSEDERVQLANTRYSDYVNSSMDIRFTYDQLPAAVESQLKSLESNGDEIFDRYALFDAMEKVLKPYGFTFDWGHPDTPFLITETVYFKLTSDQAVFIELWRTADAISIDGHFLKEFDNCIELPSSDENDVLVYMPHTNDEGKDISFEINLSDFNGLKKAGEAFEISGSSVEFYKVTRLVEPSK